MCPAEELDNKFTAARLFYSKCSLYATGNYPKINVGRPSITVDYDYELPAYITGLYGFACSKLLERHTEISEIYLWRKKIARFFLILNADRTDGAVKDSVHYFGANIYDLLEELKSYHDPNSIISVGVLRKNCIPRWDILEQTSTLLMEEITFLSKRVDEITNLMIGLVGQILTLIAISLAVVGLFLSATGTGFDVYNFFTSKDSENIGAIRETVVGPSFSQTDSSNFKQLTDKLNNLHSSFENFSLKQDGPFQSLVSELKKVSQDNEKLKTDFSDILKSKSPNITVSPNINITIPEQKPSVKANGLINVNSH